MNIMQRQFSFKDI